MTARPRSVPPSSSSSRITRSSHSTTSPSNTLLAVHRTSTTIPSSNDKDSSANASSTTASRLAAQAEMLAKMTLEMNLRSVTKQAERLETELRTLVQGTARNAEFRAQNETRLQDMWKEILAVKAHMAQDRETKHLADEACRRETKRVMEEMRGEIADVKERVSGLATAVAEMPTAEQMQTALSQSSSSNGDRQDSQQPSSKVQMRIRDALKSSRRWNRDHKTTRLPDAVFCANYLKQQSKRDAGMAVFLQRAIQRRVQARFPGRQWRPRSLEDFCRAVQWADIKTTVEDVLLRDTADVTLALSE